MLHTQQYLPRVVMLPMTVPIMQRTCIRQYRVLGGIGFCRSPLICDVAKCKFFKIVLNVFLKWWVAIYGYWLGYSVAVTVAEITQSQIIVLKNKLPYSDWNCLQGGCKYLSCWQKVIVEQCLLSSILLLFSVKLDG